MPSADGTERQSRIARLRRLLERVERRHGVYARLDHDPSRQARATDQGVGLRMAPWMFGCPPLDDLVGCGGLARHGVHEIKPATTFMGDALTGLDDGSGRDPNRSVNEPLRQPSWASAEATALGFALAMGRRAVAGQNAGDDAIAPSVGGVSRLIPAAQGPDIVVCRPRSQALEVGGLYARGLSAFGIDGGRVLLVETRDDAESLWVMEEALRAEAASVVIGLVRDVALTPARRLALAADEGATPCLAVTHRDAAPLAASASRWRVGPLPGAPHRLANRTPGRRRYGVALERLRTAPAAARGQLFALEWCHETFRFDLVSGVRDRAPAPGHTHTAQSHAGHRPGDIRAQLPERAGSGLGSIAA